MAGILDSGRRGHRSGEKTWCKKSPERKVRIGPHICRADETLS